MRSRLSIVLLCVAALSGILYAASVSGLWPVGGQNTDNTRYQAAETKINVSNVSTLVEKWSYLTQGDVSATPAVDSDNVYFPDWAGYLHAVDRQTGLLRWKTEVKNITGVPSSDPVAGVGGVV